MTIRKVNCHLFAYLAAFLAVCLAPSAHAEVISLTVGIDSTCPYGLTA